VSSYLEYFRRVVLTDPDILSEHGEQIVAYAEKHVARARGATLTSGQTKGRALPALRTFELVPL
jgi:hypothetical protein